MSDVKSIHNKDKEKVLPFIIAVDFDGTLVENKFPDIGEIRTEMWNAIAKSKEDGAKVILYTCRTGELLDDAVAFCHSNGMSFDAINDNIDEVKAVGWYARKVFANVYLDDRACVLSRSSGFVPVKLEVD